MATVVLNNLKSCMKLWQLSSSSFQSSMNISSLNIKNVYGTTLSTVYSSDMNYAPLTGDVTTVLTSNSSKNANGGLHLIGFGNGTAEVTENDYVLGNLITSGIAYINDTSKYSFVEEDGIIKRTLALNINCQNTSDSPITINEVGLFYVVKPYSGNSYPVLIYREVLETPLIVDAGVAFTVKMTAEADFDFTF